MKHVKQLLLVFGFFLFFSCSGELVDEIKDLDKSVITKKTKSQWEERDLFQVNFYQIGNLKSKFSDQKFLLNEGLIIEEIDFKTYQKANEIKILSVLAHK